MWVEVTVRATYNIVSRNSSPISDHMEWAYIQWERQQKEPLFVSKENIIHFTFLTLERS